MPVVIPVVTTKKFPALPEAGDKVAPYEDRGSEERGQEAGVPWEVRLTRALISGGEGEDYFRGRQAEPG